MSDRKQDPTEQPRYEHDCTACKFLGIHDDCDLYWCDQGGRMPTVIARFGSDGRDYSSGLRLAEHDATLAVAKGRAIAKGYRCG